MILDKLNELIDYYQEEIKKIDEFDMGCCDHAEQQTLEAVLTQLEYVLKEETKELKDLRARVKEIRDNSGNRFSKEYTQAHKCYCEIDNSIKPKGKQDE